MTPCTLLVMVGVAAVLPSILAHGYIKQPSARQLCVEYPRKVYLGSGAGITTKNPPNGGVPGFCGDPFISPDDYSYESDFASTPCYIQETYEEGGVMAMQYQVTANHGGFVKCNICDSMEMTEECFNAHPLRTCAIILSRVETKNIVEYFRCSAADSAAPNKSFSLTRKCSVHM